MKRQKKKPMPEEIVVPPEEREVEGDAVKPGSDTATAGQNGIDAIQALQFGAIAFIILFLLWCVLRFVLHVI